MRQFVDAFGGLIPTAVWLLPMVVVGFALAVLLRFRVVGPALAFSISMVDAVLTFCAGMATYLVATPQPGGSGSRVRLIPGDDLGVAVHAAPGDVGPWLQLFGNLLLLLPLGALVPLRVTWFGNWGRIALLAFSVTCAIELFQFTMLTGRVASSDDILLNTTGAVFGAAVSRRWWLALSAPTYPAWVRWGSGLWAAPAGRHALRPQYARSGS